jgi:hypothetical protein
VADGDDAFAALNTLTKWRTLFAGWQLGTRAKGDPECDAVRDHRELTILLRAEMSALVGLLLRKGILTLDEWTSALADEARALSRDYELKFPGVTASESGLQMDLEKVRQAGWAKNWKP